MNMYNMRIHMTFTHEFVKLLGSKYSRTTKGKEWSWTWNINEGK